MTARDASDAVVRPATAADGEALARIYNHFVRETIVTFEEEPISPGEMSRRIEDIASASLPWLVAERDAIVVGYAYAAPWRTRRAYRLSTEITVYVAPDQAGRGFGSRLYSQLLPALRDRQIHAVMGGIALPNDASVALHEKLGFRKVAHFEQVGFKFDRWIDVGYWQRIL
jgi:L-amino acid N-acyltransferase YncA